MNSTKVVVTAQKGAQTYFKAGGRQTFTPYGSVKIPCGREIVVEDTNDSPFLKVVGAKQPSYVLKKDVSALASV